MTTADAWVLYAGEGGLVRETVAVPRPGLREVVAEPLYGCWEGNMTHALERRPVDVCVARGEPSVVLGNGGVVRVVEVGAGVRSLEPGDQAIVFCNAVADRYGYPERILAYDAPGTTGVLATRLAIGEAQLVRIPHRTRHPLAAWAAFSLRYVTAWANWELASGVFRLQVGADELPDPHVWAWGGGVAFAELDLARRRGARPVFVSASEAHRALAELHGLATVDRRAFEALAWDEERAAGDPAWRDGYRDAEARFLETVAARTGGAMVQIFVDNIGLPVHRATLRALSREGVITTAGWKSGMNLTHLRARECIERHQHVNTHYARRSEAEAAVAYAEESGWMAPVAAAGWTFDEVPRLAEAHAAGAAGLFPVFRVNA